ncbi:10804_t:CDS:2 [Funneliformis mosseae]|uniref:10804_t:CDS:1 n=1 Tax=Funneliformis mosseae TaxID=27381 RepID=A0A9N9BBB1_FUNMO|nr:10804_t:CDS:2 [Funneliformis mosseae]
MDVALASSLYLEMGVLIRILMIAILNQLNHLGHLDSEKQPLLDANINNIVRLCTRTRSKRIEKLNIEPREKL